MACSIKKLSIKKLKGGALYLLSFFLSVHITFGQIHWSADKNPESENYGQVSIGAINTDGLDALTELSYVEWTSFFSLRVYGSHRSMLGNYDIMGSQLVFTPRFLPDPEVTYRVLFSAPDLKKYLTDFSEKTEIDALLQFDSYQNELEGNIAHFPEIDTLPSNVLRMYLQFPVPMSFENPYQYISIADASGNVLNDPFVEIEEGLWDPERTRLTLLFHPGRIKRGVGPNMTLGEIFEEGNTYQLNISKKWKTSSGIQLEERFVKRFYITGEIRKTITPKTWSIQAVSAESKDPLIIRTNHLLDQALAERLIYITDSKEKAVPGNLQFEARSRQLIFMPDKNWETGSYTITIDSKLEDICGNTIYHVFDLEGEGMVKSDMSKQISFVVK
ncbi:MAG: hypothetical protein RIM99_01000 [Cyclobacteriaceae bacterium]